MSRHTPVIVAKKSGARTRRTATAARLAPASLLALALSAGLTGEAAQGAASCMAIDPSSTLAGITGDFEMTADPDDPAGGMLFVSNTTGGVTATQNVIVAHLNGTTGKVVPGSLTVVANNYYGNSDINGPEWFRTPQGQLGIVYAGVGGVHAVFRGAPPTAWNAFLYDYTGAPANGAAPTLPNTANGNYPAPPIVPPVAQSDYPQYNGACTSACFGNYRYGLATDVRTALTPLGYTSQTAAQASWSGYVYLSACVRATGACGLYLASIDGRGGLSGLTLLAPTGATAPAQLVAYPHPVTGASVVFTNETPGTISVWEQRGPAAPLIKRASVPAPAGADHFRAAASNTQVVLNYLLKTSGPGSGSYTIAVSASGGALSVGPTNEISTVTAGSELDWYPAAGSWGLVYHSSTKGYTGCWVTP